MPTQELINSGLLELYVAGVLSDKEARMITEAAALHPEVKAEIDAIENQLIRTLDQGTAAPGKELKEAIWDEIKDDAVKNIKPISTKLRRWQIFAAAASVLFIINCFTIAWLANSRGSFKKQYQQAAIHEMKLLHEHEEQAHQLAMNSADLKILRSHDFKKSTLKAINTDNPSMICVYYNPKTKAVWVDNCGLNTPAADKQYQLWAMVNGKPVDAGLLDEHFHDNGLQALKPMSNAAAFAITLEPKGGSSVPTMTQLQVIGSI